MTRNEKILRFIKLCGVTLFADRDKWEMLEKLLEKAKDDVVSDALPEKVDPLDNLYPVQDQGQLGCSAAMAVTGAARMNLASKSYHWKPEPSQLRDYFQAQIENETPEEKQARHDALMADPAHPVAKCLHLMDPAKPGECITCGIKLYT